MKTEIGLDMDEEDLLELVRTHGEAGSILQVIHLLRKEDVKEITITLRTEVI